MRRLAVLSVLVALAGQTAQPNGHAHHREAAFGFFKGMTLKQAQTAAPLKRAAPNMYATAEPPQPIYPFILYMIAVTPSAGICAAVAETDGRSISDPGAARAIQESMSTLLHQLGKRYGPATKLGELNPDDPLGPLDLATWTDPQGAHTSIILGIRSRPDRTTFIHIAYSFSNLDKCQADVGKAL
jgi:hypothetical protein